jgi:S1-C subfamily serine protease
MTFRGLVWLALGLLWTNASLADDPVRQSVVRILATIRKPDVHRPWTKHAPEEFSGTGVVIAGKRVLTNAHLVIHAADVQIQATGLGEKFSANVEFLAPGIDLAVIKLDDESFFDDHPALTLEATLPRIRDQVSVYGYATGGNDLSVTKGIVSRIEFNQYQYLTNGLVIQVDAAINPGNSGGPALVGDRMIGIAFSRLEAADNIGYIIPAEEITTFLSDLADGRYDGKPVLLDEFQHIENPALRRSLKLPKNVKGVLVSKAFDSAEASALKTGDVVTRIGDRAIDNTGMVKLDGDISVDFEYFAQKLARDNVVPMTIVRGGKTIEIEAQVGPQRDRWLTPYLKDGTPSYFMYGPLVLSEATDDFINSLHAMPGVAHTMSFQANPMMTRYGERPAFPGERLVIVAHPLFSHRIAQGYHNPYTLTVKSVNGVEVKNLAHFVQLVHDDAAEFTRIRFAGNNTEEIVFNRADAIRATEDVLRDNGIRGACSDDLAPLVKSAQQADASDPKPIPLPGKADSKN